MSGSRVNVRRFAPVLVGLLVIACGAPAPVATPSSRPSTSAASVPVASATQAANTPSTSGSPGAPATTGATPSIALPTPTAPGATGGTVRIGMAGFPDLRNPGNGLLEEAYWIYELVYDQPIALNADGTFRPELATSWTLSDDQLTWTLKIVDNAKFHDGTPLTAEDIAFSMRTYQDTPRFAYLPDYTEGMTSIEATDPTTLVITTEKPIANFESRMIYMYALPKHIWEGVDPYRFNNNEMIGSGPFRLTDYQEGLSVSLEAVKDYWQGPPNVDGVSFQRYETSDARVRALQEGQLDLITEFSATALPALQNDSNIGVLIADPPSGDLIDIFFNVADKANCPTDVGGKCTAHPAVQDVEVRRALAEATDKQLLIEISLLGLGYPGLSFVPRSMGDYYASEVPDYAYSPEAANARLDAAGYLDNNGDGIRECKADQECPTGDLTLRFNYPKDSDVAAREADLISDMWSEVGVALDVQGLGSNALTAQCCPAFDYDVIRWSWGIDPDPASLLSVANCDSIESGYNETGYCNPAYDQLYELQQTQTDRAERVATVHQMQRELIEQAIYIIPYWYQTTEAYRVDAFTGWDVGNPNLGLEAAEQLTVVRPVQ